MKMIKIGNRQLVMKFTTKICKMMNLEGITVKSISEDLKNNFDTSKLNKAFFYSLQAMQKDITEDEAYDLLDLWLEEGKDGEELQLEIMEELMKAMGFGKQFKKMMQEHLEKEAQKEN